MAASLGVTAASISTAINQDPEYQAAQGLGAAHQLNRRERELEQASDGLGVQRARELLSLARWRLERMNPGVWGQTPRTAVQVNAGGPAEIRIISWADTDQSDSSD